MRFEMYPTIVTPYGEDGKIDYESLGRLIDTFARIGCEGVFAVCQSSEMFFLSEEEKLKLAAFSVSRCRERGMKCVVSGHTQDGADAQISYLKQLEKLAPDAIILVSNRLAGEDEGDEKALETLKTVLDALLPETRLGMYECPYPYKRPLTPALIEAMKKDGRFRFIKDTCCKIDEIRARLKLIEGSPISLCNANMATLRESVLSGAAGYSGVMLNVSPELLWLLHEAAKNGEDARAEKVCTYLSMLSTIEYQNYPANAKFLLMRKGLCKTLNTRTGKPPLTESQQKELIALEDVSRRAFFARLKRAPHKLVCGYDTCFNECHASSVLPLAGGKTLISYFAGEREGAGDVGIWLSVYENGVFRAPRQIAKVNGEAHWNPVLYQTDEGIRLVFKAGRTIQNWVSHTCLSKDGGESWSEPEKYPESNPAGGPVRNKPLRLKSGVYLAPASDETLERWQPRIDFSKDGRMFEKYALIPVCRDPGSENFLPGKGAIQPALWEDEKGVHALLRTTADKIYRSDSADGGRTWCEAYPTALPGNNSAIDVCGAGGKLYLAMNPVSTRERTPLCVLVSEDGGDSFMPFMTLEDGVVDDAHARTARFAYPSISERDGRVYVSFTHNRKSIGLAEI